MSHGFNWKKEDTWRFRASLPFLQQFNCFFFHRRSHYVFRYRTYDNDAACSKCQTQWIE